MRIIWNMDKTIAIPISKIVKMEIIETKGWTNDRYKDYTVEVSYVIGIGEKQKVYTSNDRSNCETFINDLGEYT